MNYFSHRNCSFEHIWTQPFKCGLNSSAWTSASEVTSVKSSCIQFHRLEFEWSCTSPNLNDSKWINVFKRIRTLFFPKLISGKCHQNKKSVAIFLKIIEYLCIGLWLSININSNNGFDLEYISSYKNMHIIIWYSSNFHQEIVIESFELLWKLKKWTTSNNLFIEKMNNIK